jgi:hypothetical protein
LVNHVRVSISLNREGRFMNKKPKKPKQKKDEGFVRTPENPMTEEEAEELKAFVDNWFKSIVNEDSQNTAKIIPFPSRGEGRAT